MPRVRPSRGKKRTWQCPFCEHRPFKRRDMYELHVKESHPDVVAAPPMHEAPAGNNDDNDGAKCISREAIYVSCETIPKIV